MTDYDIGGGRYHPPETVTFPNDGMATVEGEVVTSQLPSFLWSDAPGTT